MAKQIETNKTYKLFGLRVIVGTFDKHNPTTLYFAGTINCEGFLYDGDLLRKVGIELKQVFDSWIKKQEDYDRQYIRIVDMQDDWNKAHSWNHITYHPKNKHIKFDLTLKLKKRQPWKEAAENARNNIDMFYPDIVEVIGRNGMILKDFKGNTLESRISDASQPQ